MYPKVERIHLSKHSPGTKSRLIVPVLRGSYPIGVLDLESDNEDHFSHASLPTVESILRGFDAVLDQQYSTHLMAKLWRPISFPMSRSDFYALIAAHACDAARMQFASLRLATEDHEQVHCVGIAGLGDRGRTDEWSLVDLQKFPDFQRGLTLGVTQTTPSVREAPHGASVASNARTKGIQSYAIVPIRREQHVIGLLTLATTCEHEYSDAEIAGFECIANGIGVSLDAFDQFRGLGSDLDRFKSVAVAITGIEVAQAARHESLGVIDDVAIRTLTLRGSRKVDEQLDAYLQGVSADLNRLRSVLAKIKEATSPPAAQLKEVELRDVWNAACETVRGRLNQLQVAAGFDGNVQVVIHPEWIRHVFLNLILNSIDAFQRTKKRGRRIDLSVVKNSPKATYVELRYTDNGTGLDVQRLRVPDEFVDDDLAQVIFQPGVTGRRNGSGYGLVLARKIMDLHRGSIDLLDYRNGMTFQIKLSKSLGER